MNTINKIIASVTKLHGGEREQTSKHDDYLNFQRRLAQCGGQPVVRRDRFPMPTVPHRESNGDE